MPAGTVLHLACHHRRYLFGTDGSVPAVATCVPCRKWRVAVVDHRDAVVGVDVHGPGCDTGCVCGLDGAQADAEAELLGHA